MVAAADILHGKILVVDDQEANVLLLEQMLRNAGYDAITVTTDPFRVCELHLLNHYDLILLDLQMPGMDGFEVMANLKQIEAGGYLPVLVITAQPDHKLRALRAGAKDFVSKPFDLAEVLLRVSNMLEVRLLHGETLTLYHQLLAEQRRSERGLLNVLPQAIAEALSGAAGTGGGEAFVAQSYAEMTVLFADLVDFTRFAQGASAAVLAGVLDEVSARLDHSVDGQGLDRERTLSDAYLAAADLPDPLANHSIAVADKALDLAESLDRFNRLSRHQVRVRIGLNAGAKTFEI